MLMAEPQDVEPSPLWKAITLTIISVTLLNLTVAYLVARQAGLRSIEIPSGGVLLLAGLGGVTLVGAVAFWKAFLRNIAARSDADAGSGQADSGR